MADLTLVEFTSFYPLEWFYDCDRFYIGEIQSNLHVKVALRLCKFLRLSETHFTFINRLTFVEEHALCFWGLCSLWWELCSLDLDYNCVRCYVCGYCTKSVEIDK